VKGDSPSLLTSVTGSAQTSTNKPSASPDMSFYKAVQQSNPDSQLPATASTAQPAATDSNAASSNTNPTSGAATAGATTTPSTNSGPDQLSNTNGYLVQVAAVTKEEDADALVDALKKKQYPAFATTNAVDKLVHVQVGPFNDMKQAEDTRTKLMNDGYNPILKK
jgi:cell division septation protein DedD